MSVYGPYPAVVTSVHDGDTCRLDISLGFGIHATAFSARFEGINAPELATPAGKVAVAYLESIMPVGSRVSVTSYGWDKYAGRFDAVIVCNGLNINQALLDSGHAVPYP